MPSPKSGHLSAYPTLADDGDSVRDTARRTVQAAAPAIRKQERERVLKQIDAIEATLHEFYHGGNDEQVEAVQGAITDARAELEDSDA